jgi:hypothetical protein
MTMAMQLLLWGKAGCEYPDFLVEKMGWGGRFSATIFPITRARTGQA